MTLDYYVLDGKYFCCNCKVELVKAICISAFRCPKCGKTISSIDIDIYRGVLSNIG